MRYLRTGDPVVVDTHVFAEAAVAWEDGERDSSASAHAEEPCEAVAFMRAVIGVCARIRLSSGQSSALEKPKKDELSAAFRHRRVPFRGRLVKQLDDLGKLRRTGPVGVLPARLLEQLDGNRRDDLHLFEAALARPVASCVVTRDEGLLDRARAIERVTTLPVVDPQSALASLSQVVPE